VKRSIDAHNKPWIVLAASLLVSFGVWRWADQILVPVYTAKAVERGRPIGNNSDLYPLWLTSREVLLQGKAPYSADLTRDIQKGFYGRELDAGNPADPADLQAFVYPLYVIFFLAPTVKLPFATVVEIFRWLLLFCIAAAVPLWAYAIGFRARWALVASMTVLAVSSFPAVLEDRQQNISALVVLLLAGAMAATVRHWFTLGGFLLALSTVKPQLSGLLIAWMLLWALSGWRARGKLVWSFVVTFLGLLAAATAISPGWMAGFWAAVRAYRSYGMGPSIFQLILPPILAVPVILMLIGFVAVICWKWRKAQPESLQFGWTLALVATVTVTLTTQAAHYQLLLVPALLMLLRHHAEASGIFVRAFIKGAFACQIWQWLAALSLAVLSLLVTSQRVFRFAQLPLYTLLALPALTLLAVLAAIVAGRSTSVREARDHV
jgi:hypothetical protein